MSSTSLSATLISASTTGTFSTPQPAPTTNGNGFSDASPSSSSPPPQGPPPPPGPGPPSNNASLYLYTFLATLLLLLGVSGVIVVRSFLLRRQNRRMIEEAIANGTYVPPTFGFGAGGVGRGRVKLGEKPKMGDVVLKRDEDNEKWHVQPFALRYTNPTSSLTFPSSQTLTRASRPRRPLRHRFASIFLGPSPSRPQPSRTSSTHSLQPVNIQGKEVEMGVIIAMPSPVPFHEQESNEDGEMEVPLVEIGVMKIDVVKDDEEELAEGNGKEIVRDSVDSA